ncbi:hypothetical protein FOA43_001129 [Brettanomyces nanus]|uniref:Uncharacterized protein n=1 Tax=Eeniella nana TaxID=13502 RepID=A0A875S0G8_EENNA|nr:uncharacterized protein FOA43_001129 [Brettanomyces nanus]QPG73815.1 hypothetical protein FOA43_001129 [Brettanomyces nanus]
MDSAPNKVIVNTVVNANNAFISSLDHLPCEVVRSLWLIQSLNLKNAKIRARLQESSNISGQDEVRRLSSYLSRNSKECEAESRQIRLVLKNHLKFIDNDLKILDRLCKFKTLNKDPKQQRKKFSSFKKKFIKEHAKEIRSASNYTDQHSTVVIHIKHPMKIKINLRALKDTSRDTSESTSKDTPRDDDGFTINA